MGLLDRLSHAWNAFFGKGPPYDLTKPIITTRYENLGYSTTYRPDRPYFTRGQERSLITTIYNRIAVDVAAVDIRHVKVDDNGRFQEEVDDDLNECLKTSANKDQTAREFIRDVVISMFDEGCVAVVPVDTDIDPKVSTSFSIESMRVGKIVTWFPDKVEVELYNDRIGQKQTIIVPKKSTAIIENPFYAIMNEPNSVMQRLIRKFNLLDVVDAQNGSGKLNLIVQLPYVIKTPARQAQAAQRRADIEDQLGKSQYGIAYTDGTEKITQLNRPAENNLLEEVKYLTSMAYTQLCMTEAILNGTADEKTMLNYTHRIVVPILCAITEEFRRKFLTKTARSQKHTIMFFNDPFKLVPISSLADIADKFTRNEIMSSNEMRQVVGLKPSTDPKADELRNKNINQPGNGEIPPVITPSEDPGNPMGSNLDDAAAKELADLNTE